MLILRTCGKVWKYRLMLYISNDENLQPVPARLKLSLHPHRLVFRVKKYAEYTQPEFYQIDAVKNYEMKHCVVSALVRNSLTMKSTCMNLVRENSADASRKELSETKETDGSKDSGRDDSKLSGLDALAFVALKRRIRVSQSQPQPLENAKFSQSKHYAPR